MEGRRDGAGARRQRHDPGVIVPWLPEAIA
jgi:hypothetical protein